MASSFCLRSIEVLFGLFTNTGFMTMNFPKEFSVSRYKLYLPAEEELATEIIKERKTIEMEKRLSEGGPRP